MSKKLRIMLNSNAPWATSGYSNQVAEFLPYWVAAGYQVAMIDFYGLDGGKIMIDGVLHYPKMNHLYGSDAMVHHAKDFKADVVFAFQDQWVLHPDDLKNTTRYIPIVPIDHDPAPPPVLEKLQLAYRIVTYSKFGHKELQRQGLHSTYIPHTVNTEIFKPMDKAERKRAAGIPEDVFICGMVGANKDNPPRKAFQQVMDAFKEFCKIEQKAMLYIHTNPDFPGGFPIKQYANFIGISDRLIYPDPYQMSLNMDKNAMAHIYNTFDVLLMPSVSEGFGVPAIEAQACGIPVIVNNWTSMPELVINKKTGYVCEHNDPTYSHLGSYVATPSAKSIYNCLVDVRKADRDKMAKAAREHVVKEYDTKTICEKLWIPYLEKLENEIYVAKQ